MAAAKTGRKKRTRGEIIALKNGAHRVKVYAGNDPLTGRRHYLDQTVPPGPTSEADAEALRVQFVHEVNERRNPRTKATVNQLMDRYLELLDVETTTKKRYEGVIRAHVRPLLGDVSIARLDGESFESFYKVLRTCRTHCGGRKFVEHGYPGEHKCDQKCHAHKCKPLATSTINKIHWCLSGAMKSAVRWRWLSVNPLDQAEPPRSQKANPQPPTSDQAAAIVTRALKDLGWGTLVWLAMTTGARRGELCAIRWDSLNLDDAVLWLRTSIAQDGAETWEKGTKTHQQRRIALDPETVALLRLYRQHCEDTARELDVTLTEDGRVFSPEPDHFTWIKPSTVSQRYRRMCEQLGWDMHLHQLRHYSATELISAGVDVRTVAGRLGHGGGGSTTLRVYTAWLAEADQKAAGNMSVRMPALPGTADDTARATTRFEPEPDSPYQKIAADLRGAIASGVLTVGDKLPPIIELANRYEVSVGTAHRAIAELKEAGLVAASRGKRAIVADPTMAAPIADVVRLDTKKAK